VDQLGAILPIVLLGGAFWLLIIRPSRARQASARATAARLEAGARVMTTAGLFGTVVRIEGDELDLEIAPGVVVRYVAAAIAKVIPETTSEESSAAAEAGAGPGTDGELPTSSSGDDTPGA
jgi:preprotein translocase subunit YajC